MKAAIMFATLSVAAALPSHPTLPTAWRGTVKEEGARFKKSP